MNRILVNASAAKEGGAKTIIESYLESLSDANFYIVIAPKNVKCNKSNVKMCHISTSGFFTILFSTLLISYYVLRFRVNYLLSFNNINLVIPLCKRITYYHQAKIFEETNLKTKVYFYLIKYFLLNTHFIVQSEGIKRKFVQLFSIKSSYVKVRWPGFTLVENTGASFDKEIKAIRNLFSFIAICPIYDIKSNHKNVAFLQKNAKALNDMGIAILFTTSIELNEPNFFSIGKLERKDLFSLYQISDFLIFPSLLETVGLPIFEFLSFGRPAFVLKCDYIVEFNEYFVEPGNLIIFSEHDFLDKVDKNKKLCVEPTDLYSKSDWNIFK